MSPSFLALPILFGFVTPLLSQVTGAESTILGPAIGGTVFGALFALVLRWLLTSFTKSMEKIEERLKRLEQTHHEANEIQLMQMAERSAIEAVRSEAERRLAEHDRANKNPHG